MARRKMQRRGMDCVDEPVYADVLSIEWQGPIEGYTKNYLAKNYWRVASVMDWDDAMQESRAIFVECVIRYKDKVDNPAWFMSLYKTVLFSRFTNYANYATRQRHVVFEHQLVRDDDEADSPITQRDEVGDSDNNGYLATLVREAPADVKEVLALFLNAPVDLLESAIAAWQSRNGKGGVSSRLLCALLGREVDEDVIGRVQEYFMGTVSV